MVSRNSGVLVLDDTTLTYRSVGHCIDQLSIKKWSIKSLGRKPPRWYLILVGGQIITLPSMV